MREEKKAEKRQELVGVCLDCFVEKGLTVTTTKDLCRAAKLHKTAASTITSPPKRKSFLPVPRKRSVELKKLRLASCLKILVTSKA